MRQHWKRKLDEIGSDAVQRSVQTRTYGDVTYRAIRSHFHKVVAYGDETLHRFRRADDSAFFVVLDSAPDRAVLYIGNEMQYMVWVERLRGKNCVVQEIPTIRRELPDKLRSSFRLR